MKDKVDELVERVRLTPQEINTCYMEADIPKKGYIENTKAVALYTAEYQLRKILKDPDLALIDKRNVGVPCVDLLKYHSTNPSTYWIEKEVQEVFIQSNWKPVIPLAEAIKKKPDKPMEKE